MSDAADGRPNRALAAIQKKVVAGALGEALVDLQSFLSENPDDNDGLYLQAVVLRYSGRIADSLAVLARLKTLSPTNGRVYQEEGHALLAAKQAEAALASYRRAVELNPALKASLKAQIGVMEYLGRERDLIWARARLAQLEEMPDALVAVMDLVAQNKLAKAEDLCRRYLVEHPKSVAGMRLLADIGMRLGVLEDAEFLLESAVVFEPDNVEARVDYVNLLRKRQKFEKALKEAKTLLHTDPDNPRFQSVCAIEHMQMGDYDQALTLLDDVLTKLPGDAATLTTRGHALKTCGRTEDAVASYQEATRCHPSHGEAYYSLANLKTYRFSDQELDQMLALDADGGLADMDRVHLSFALGKAWEDREDFERAFHFYRQGNSLKRAQSRYDADRIHEEFQQTRSVCSEAFFSERDTFGSDAPDPIFILGLPRAGSTLLEQILSSHSQVDGTLELPNILSLSQRLRRKRVDGARPGYPFVLEHLSAEDCLKFAQEFLDDTRVHRAGAPMFIDKMPNNFRHIGLIRLMFPNAKIIDARREPMACCFSGYKQLFAEGQEFSYDLVDIGRYYLDYVDLMDHWDAVLPGYVLRVQHEQVVADLETEVRRMLDFCGLPFEERCLRYFETERNVRTPSSEQVRQPIFRDSVEQWRQFEPWLGPLKETLQGDTT